MTELLPCPFCGGKVSFSTWEAYSTDASYSCVKCPKCLVTMPCDSPRFDYTSRTWSAQTAEAIAAWNRRAPVWQPIATAPKDGRKFDAWVPDPFGGHRMCNLSFSAKGMLRQDGILTAADIPRFPTHWQPLPAPPQEPTNE